VQGEDEEENEGDETKSASLRIAKTMSRSGHPRSEQTGDRAEH